MAKIEIWRGGFMSQGDSAPTPAIKLSTVEADNFDEAVKTYITEQASVGERNLYSCNKGRHSIWGCTLFDNEADARKGIFG